MFSLELCFSDNISTMKRKKNGEDIERPWLDQELFVI